jgi:cytidylate kinase
VSAGVREEGASMAIPKQGPVVAIDGPAGTGKSSVTRRLADSLGFIHVDTGALYRAVALKALEQAGATTPDALEGPALEKAAEIARQSHLEFRRDKRRNPANRILIDGRDVTQLIRTPEVSMAASRVSSVSAVRAALVGLQRRLGCVGRTILEGRDIGTVIFPDADVKFFMTASVEERAKRRLTELEATGADAPSFAEVKAQIAERDQADMSRAIAPLKRAPDAIEVDTTSMTLDEVVRHMESIVRERIGVK